MSKEWIRQKRPEFVRDVVREFCVANKALEEQFAYFDRFQRLDFEILRDLLGGQNSKGLLWRLKDTAHHLFRNDREVRLVGEFLDWGLGYIFHETIKLKEDAYQQQAYAPWFRELQAMDLPREESIICQELYQVITQTRESIHREIKRVRFIMFHCRRLFPIYLASHSENPLLARFFFESRELVKHVFGRDEKRLLCHIYGETPEILPILASQSYRRGGWIDLAEQAVEAAEKLNPQSVLVLQEKEIVDNWKRKLKV
ncbi:MAG: hypothetical protein ACNI3A_15100 [Desulfovibrio sp.]|uniref:hypothetical protein n=1 Tax=Desulfovibrio sp. 7SRBS1 TaxID=3378064 RepID=UPI003B3F4C6B